MSSQRRGPYRRRGGGAPPTAAELRSKEKYKKLAKKSQRNESRMRRYYDRKLRGSIVVGLLFVASLVGLAVWWFSGATW